MKVQTNFNNNYTSQNNGVNNNSQKRNIAFKGIPFLVPFATFIENNGFLGEFLTVDTVGMMGPRTYQGYTRNKEELGHLNYKAGREELIRELLSGPAYFAVPLGVISAVAFIAGKCAQVESKTLDLFKGIMGKTSANIKDADALKKEFIDKLAETAFKDYKNETGSVNEIKEFFYKATEENAKMSTRKAGTKASEVLTRFNKANAQFLDNTSIMMQEGKNAFSIKSLISDSKNYLEHFTKKAATTDKTREAFIESFHKNSKNLRNAANILGVAALSMFLLYIPKLYQTGKLFPGKDGLKGAGQAPATGNNNNKEVKEAENANK